MKHTHLHKLYFFCLFSNLLAMLGGIVCVGFLVKCCWDIFKNSQVTPLFVALAVIAVILTVLVVILAKNICPLLKDLGDVKNKNYITIVAQVKLFKKDIHPDSGKQSNTYPIVSIVDTKDELELSINDEVVLGKTYKFIYLKNSHLAEVVEQVELTKPTPQ